jgi:DNA-binding GntR family transcriptional regulator
MEVLSTSRSLGRVTLQDRVYQELKRGLIAGEFTPGQALTVKEIAQTVGTSAMPVREAFRRLAAEHALEIQLSGTARVRALAAGERTELLKIRCALEGMAARSAAKHIDEQDLRLLERLNEEMGDAMVRVDVRLGVLRNQEFHFVIYRAAGSSVLYETIEMLWTRTGPYLTGYMRNALRLRQGTGRRTVMHNHGRILDALRRGDPRGAQAALRNDLMEAAKWADPD